jgi:hypothetical protein
MKRDSIGRLWRPEATAEGLETLTESTQLGVERLGDEYFIETSVECGHWFQVYGFSEDSRRPGQGKSAITAGVERAA